VVERLELENYKDIVSNASIYELGESLIASGYAMRTKIHNDGIFTAKDLARGKKLAKASILDNGAHGQFMTGILVAFDLTFTVKAWTEAERYKFLNFVTSQSTMHRITKFDLDKSYVEYVDPRIIDIMKEKVAEYNNATGEEKKKKYLEILYSNPCGMKLTARMTTNYRQLRNIYIQRKNHRLPEWREFCKWIETLPFFDELIKADYEKENN
jgi:hypothetical protein